MKELLVAQPDYTFALDAHTVWFQASRAFGGMAPEWDTNAAANLDRARATIEPFIPSEARLVRMRPNGGSFVDLACVDQAPEYRTDGLITADPNDILWANPADCGEIAVHGPSRKLGRAVIGLFHASREIVSRQEHMRGLEYLCDTYEVPPETLTVRLSPSARRESYVFPEIDDHKKTAPRWEGHVEQDTQGLWHVDFHGRTVADLQEFGIPDEQMAVSAIDTITNPRYASCWRERVTGEAPSVNSLLFALRSDVDLTAAA